MKVIFKTLILSAIVLAACKNQKKAVEATTKDQKVEQRAQEAIEEDAPTQTPSGELIPEAETKAQINRAKNKLSDSLVARIQRTACFGRCPIYTASIYQSGLVLYQGEKWVEKEGMFQAKMTELEIKSLLEKAKSVGFFEMNEAYDSPYVTDLPSTIITLRNDDIIKIVANRYEGPEALRTFEMFFDELLNGLTYSAYSKD